jgi:hypothetical protein
MLLVLATTILATGCDEDENGRVVAVAREAADRQAEQNKEMAKVNHSVAQATERLVAADAEARKEIVKVHQQLQSEREVLNKQRDNLEVERQGIARQRLTESWIGPVIENSGILVVAVLAIGLCLLLLFGLRRSAGAEAELNELLVHELSSERPTLLPHWPAPGAIEDDKDQSASSLPLPDDESN